MLFSDVLDPQFDDGEWRGFCVLRLSMMLSTASGGVVEKNDPLTSSSSKIGFIALATVWLDVVVLFAM
jgi:hypothetical protein